MSAIDRAISWISPKWSAERSAWRTVERVQASYKGGIPTRDSEGWETLQGYRLGSIGDQRLVLEGRGRAYQAYDNNPVAKTIIDTETDNVIRDGLNYQPTTDSEEWNREAIDRYYLWLENCTVRGPDITSGCEAQRMLWTRSRIAGDIGWVLVNRNYIDPSTNRVRVGSRIQIVDAETIVTPDDKFGNTSIVDGIEYDSFLAPQNYHILTHDAQTSRRTFEQVPARDFVYLSHMTKPNQARPPSCFMPVFDLLTHLDRYVDGVSLAAWMGTVIGLVFRQANAAKQYQGLPTLTNSQGNPQAAITLENGLLKFIGSEDEVVQVNAHQPMQQTPEFINAILRLLGMAFDMPLEVIAKNMSQCTFASARIGLLPFYAACRTKAGRFGSRWSRTIRWWLSREKDRGADDPNRWTNAFPTNYWSHDLLVNAWDYTDPVSEAQADLLQLDMGTKSYKQIMNERGRDAAQTMRDNEEYRTAVGEDSIVHSTMTRDRLPEPVAPVQQSTSSDNGYVGNLLTSFILAHKQDQGDAVKAYARAAKDLLGSMRDEQPAPAINVNIPEQPPAIVNVAAPAVTVNVPERSVNVAAPEVTVNVPKPDPPKPVTLMVERDGKGLLRKIRKE